MQAPESAQKNINLKILSELKVIVPERKLQDKFAKFVEKFDKQKTTIKQSLEKLETLKKSLVQEYFGWGEKNMGDYTVYIDESGDLGINRGTQWFVLSAVVVEKSEKKYSWKN